MTKQDFLQKIKTTPDQISFQETIACIEKHYHFSETTFSNGNISNDAGQNSGSCKIFAFAKLNNLSKEETLHCFGDYYRRDVLNEPTGSNHSNIRNFIEYGWDGVSFNASPLNEK